MMNIDEAIKHCEEKAVEQAEIAKSNGDIDCLECAKEHKQLADWLKELKAYKEKPQGDLISRSALKKAISEKLGIYIDGTFNNRLLFDIIDNAPTVEIPKGGWILVGHDDTVNFYKCSICGYEEHDNFTKHYYFCPHCGADMRGDNK